jgi:hypothetical protein
MRCLSILSVIGAMGMIGCGPDLTAIPPVTERMSMNAGVEKAQLQRGRDLYMAHCHQCHNRIQPGKIDPEYWREILPHMSKNAKLNAAQLTDLQTYLIAAHGTVYQLDLQH